MSSSGDPSNATLQQKSSRRVPAWVPFAAFAGTTAVLAIPLVILARQRKTVLRKALNKSSVAPPRRSAIMLPGRVVRKSTPAPGASESESAAIEDTSPSTGELLAAISRADFSTAIYVGKAFAIATGIVTVGGVALVLGVKSLMGVRDTKEFAERMRMVLWRALPSLTSQIHRPPDVDDLDIPISAPSELDPTWKWEEAEKRMQAAYDTGGFPAWLQTALKEMEAEVHVERARREKEYERSEIRDSLS